MSISVKKKKGISFMKISGDMTIYTAAAMKSEMMKHFEPPCEREIDLSEVSDMDCAGLQLLILAKRESLRQKTPLRLTHHSHAVLDVLNLTSTAAYFGDPIWEGSAQGKQATSGK